MPQNARTLNQRQSNLRQPTTSTSPTPDSQLDELIRQLHPVLKHINLHRFLWGFMLVCAFIAWNRGLMLLYALVAFLLAVLLISYVYYFINLNGMKVAAVLPTDNVIDGDEIDIGIILDSRFSQHFIAIELLLQRVSQEALALESLSVKGLSPKDLSQQGLAKSQFLEDLADINNMPDAQTVSLFVLHSKDRQTFIAKTHLTRGVYRVPVARLDCAYPLGIIHKQSVIDVQGEAGMDSLLYVLPYSFAINKLPDIGSSSKGLGKVKSKHRGAHDEFADIRQYRRGDAFKTVHWGASARQISRGKSLMVKNYESYDIPQAVIILNQFAFASSPQAFDRMVTLALSFARYLVAQEYQVSIVGFDTPFTSLGEYWQLDLNAEIAPTSDMLRQLAEIDVLSIPSELANTASYQAFTELVLAKLPDSLVVQFFSHSPKMNQNTGNSSGEAGSQKMEGQQYQIYLNNAITHNQYRAVANNVIQYEINPHSPLADVQALFA